MVREAGSEAGGSGRTLSPDPGEAAGEWRGRGLASGEARARARAAASETNRSKTLALRHLHSFLSGAYVKSVYLSRRPLIASLSDDDSMDSQLWGLGIQQTLGTTTTDAGGTAGAVADSGHGASRRGGRNRGALQSQASRFRPQARGASIPRRAHPAGVPRAASRLLHPCPVSRPQTTGRSPPDHHLTTRPLPPPTVRGRPRRSSRPPRGDPPNPDCSEPRPESKRPDSTRI